MPMMAHAQRADRARTQTKTEGARGRPGGGKGGGGVCCAFSAGLPPRSYSGGALGRRWSRPPRGAVRGRSAHAARARVGPRPPAPGARRASRARRAYHARASVREARLMRRPLPAVIAQARTGGRRRAASHGRGRRTWARRTGARVLEPAVGAPGRAAREVRGSCGSRGRSRTPGPRHASFSWRSHASNSRCVPARARVVVAEPRTEHAYSTVTSTTSVRASNRRTSSRLIT